MPQCQVYPLYRKNLFLCIFPNIWYLISTNIELYCHDTINEAIILSTTNIFGTIIWLGGGHQSWQLFAVMSILITLEMPFLSQTVCL